MLTKSCTNTQFSQSGKANTSCKRSLQTGLPSQDGPDNTAPEAIRKPPSGTHGNLPLPLGQGCASDYVLLLGQRTESGKSGQGVLFPPPVYFIHSRSVPVMAGKKIWNPNRHLGYGSWASTIEDVSRDQGREEKMIQNYLVTSCLLTQSRKIWGPEKMRGDFTIGVGT